VIDDMSKVVSIDLKFEEDLIYVLGNFKEKYGQVPKVEAKNNLDLYRRFYKCVEKRLVSSAVSVGRGGLIMALAKTSMAGLLGIKVDLADFLIKGKAVEDVLLAENQGCLLVSVDPKNRTNFEKILGARQKFIGNVSNDLRLVVKGGGKKLVDIEVKKILKAYRSTFKNF
jgi:phosphoribosylformylglycinamidine synthase subunit PurSL